MASFNHRRRRPHLIPCNIFTGNRLLFCLFILVIFSGRRLWKHQTNTTQETIIPALTPLDLTQLDTVALTERRGISIVTTIHSHFDLVDTLSTLSGLSDTVLEILLVCPDTRRAAVRRSIHQMQAAASASGPTTRHVEILLISWPETTSETEAIVHASREASSSHILVLDQHSLDIDSLAPLLTTAYKIPVGLRGMRDHKCLNASLPPQVAAYLIPPFATPRTKLSTIPNHLAFVDWEELGSHLASAGLEAGGLVLQSADGWCESRSDAPEFSDDDDLGVFSVALESSAELLRFSPLLCRLISNGHSLRVILVESTFENLIYPCHLDDVTVSNFVLHQFVDNAHDVLLVSSALAVTWDIGGDVLAIPSEDMGYCEWMASLSLTEWKSWHAGRVEISVITHNRPDSLARLFSSLSGALYFGDRLNLRINIEQGADERTHQLVEDFRWNHGSVFVHHRVVRGGLLPAVVESWYPHSDDEYGILLEDDVELSPLFYAWAKFAILRYRYGKRRNESSKKMFGVSLYQQKSMELRMEGRQPFHPRQVFAAAGLPFTTSPYLSPIPCSWGAVYFPEHWREFHEYLDSRLLQTKKKPDEEEDIVPDVRSSRWTKSWKKFFIELSYLRGYVMLYPNLDDFLSFSTNHLEYGSHVRERSRMKQELFKVPLMQLEQASELNADLPAFEALPVLNLTGFVTDLTQLMEQGERRSRLLAN